MSTCDSPRVCATFGCRWSGGATCGGDVGGCPDCSPGRRCLACADDDNFSRAKDDER